MDIVIKHIKELFKVFKDLEFLFVKNAATLQGKHSQA